MLKTIYITISMLFINTTHAADNDNMLEEAISLAKSHEVIFPDKFVYKSEVDYDLLKKILYSTSGSVMGTAKSSVGSVKSQPYYSKVIAHGNEFYRYFSRHLSNITQVLPDDKIILTKAILYFQEKAKTRELTFKVIRKNLNGGPQVNFEFLIRHNKFSNLKKLKSNEFDVFKKSHANELDFWVENKRDSKLMSPDTLELFKKQISIEEEQEQGQLKRQKSRFFNRKGSDVTPPSEEAVVAIQPSTSDSYAEIALPSDIDPSKTITRAVSRKILTKGLSQKNLKKHVRQRSTSLPGNAPAPEATSSSSKSLSKNPE